MKIAQVCPYDFSRPGGVKNHILNLSSELINLGHEVTIITPVSAEYNEKITVTSFGRNRSLNIGGTKIDINIALGKELKTLKEFLKNEKFDIIHFHTFWNPVLPFQIWLHSKTRYVATFHDTPKNKWVGRNIMPLAARIIFRMMDRIISVSKTQARYIRRIEHQKLSIISNGIDLKPFDSKVAKLEQLNDGKFNLLFLGRLEPRKGVIYALKAFLELKKENKNLRLVIAGDGKERSLIESFISNHKLKDVVLLGQVTEKDKLSLLVTAELFLAPAIYGESFGIVLLEAMASGLPMVGFGNEGYLNIVPEEWRTFFPEPQNLDKLKSSIKTMIEDQELRGKMKQWGLEEVKKYEWNMLSRQIEQVYFSILK